MQLRSGVVIGWLMFLAYWWISAVGVKRTSAADRGGGKPASAS
jgi:hypothetical protein